MALRRAKAADAGPADAEHADAAEARAAGLEAEALKRHLALADALLDEVDEATVLALLEATVVPSLADRCAILTTVPHVDDAPPQLRVPHEGLPAVAFWSAEPLTEETAAHLAALARTALRGIQHGARVREQVAMRRTLERSLLPEAVLPVPDLQIASRYLPAAMGQDVGGDFYDAIRAGDGAVLIVGDVQGKGVEAATFTSLARHTLRTAALDGAAPDEMLAQLNRALLYGQAEQAESGIDPHHRFVTAAVAMLTPTGDGTFDVAIARAGHPPPLVVRWSGDIELFEPEGLLLGVADAPHFEVHRTHLGPSDTLVLYTDGVTEQRSPESTFDETQLGLLVRHRLDANDAEAIAQAILDTVLLVSPEGSRDDIAVLVASPSSALPASTTDAAPAARMAT